MKHAIVLAAAALALAACDGSGAEQAATVDPDAETAAIEETGDAGFEAVAPGEYEIVRADGAIDRLTVHPGLTWSMVPASGDPSGGTIFAQGGKNCFVTEGVEGHRCFLGSAPEADGSMTVTGDDGEVATVRPVAAATTTDG